MRQNVAGQSEKGRFFLCCRTLEKFLLQGYSLAKRESFMLWRSCVLRVGVIGVNFKTAELPLREAIAKSAQSLAGERSLFFPCPTVLLSTCNRTEIYFSADDLAQVQSELLSLLRRQVAEPFEHRLYSYFGIDCFAHLCRVAAGLGG